MRFKGLAILGLFALTIFYSCNKKNTVTINGIITSSKDNNLVLSKLGFYKSTTIDSVLVDKGEDSFSFKIKDINEPTFFVLTVTGKGAITLLSDPGEKVQLVIKDENLNNCSIIGSKGSLLTQKLSNKLNKTKIVLDSLKVKYELSNDSEVKSRIEHEYSVVVDSQKAFSTRFIWANTMSRASVMALYQKYNNDSYVFDNASDIILFKAVASSIKAFYPNSEYTKGMIADINRMEKIVKSSKLNELLKNSTSSIPEIALPNTKGDTVKLTSLKGKIVLLSFWASSDQNSLLDNRDLIEIYKQYKSKGFEIYQVSIDPSKEDWLNAIESAGIPWISVNELNPKGSYYARLFNISQIPSNYLIGRDQSIIGKNLFGDELKKKLREAF